MHCVFFEWWWTMLKYSDPLLRVFGRDVWVQLHVQSVQSCFHTECMAPAAKTQLMYQCQAGIGAQRLPVLFPPVAGGTQRMWRYTGPGVREPQGRIGAHDTYRNGTQLSRQDSQTRINLVSVWEPMKQTEPLNKADIIPPFPSQGTSASPTLTFLPSLSVWVYPSKGNNRTYTNSSNANRSGKKQTAKSNIKI